METKFTESYLLTFLREATQKNSNLKRKQSFLCVAHQGNTKNYILECQITFNISIELAKMLSGRGDIQEEQYTLKLEIVQFKMCVWGPK